MWLWQHKNIHKKYLLWAKLFGICLFLHLIFLFWIFCIYRDNNYILSISINKNRDYYKPIMFVPLNVQTTSRPKTIHPTKPIQQNSTVQAKPTVEKKTAVPEIKKPTTIATITPNKIEASSSAKALKDTSALTANVKKAEEVKKELPKVEPPKKPEPVVHKTQPIQPVPAQKETPQVPIAQALDIEQTVVPQSYIKASSFAEASAHTSEGAALVPKDAHISDNYREVEALRRGAQLQKELVQKWKPPIGISPECMCEISFLVNRSGVIENLKMVKCSGVIMYDISARQALCTMKMPQWTYGKPLVISFKQ
jgi:hypothetical protein